METAVPYVSIDKLTGRTIRVNDHKELSNAINDFPKKETIEWKKFQIMQKIGIKRIFLEKFLKQNLKK